MNGSYDGEERISLAIDKISEYGSSVLETRELLELLIFSAMPSGDAGAVADALLMRFGSLEGVLSAETDELLRVDGVSDALSELIPDVGRALEIGELTQDINSASTFRSYDKMGSFFVKYLSANRAVDVAAVLLDNNLGLIKIIDIPVKRYGSAAMQPKYIIDAVIRCGATVVAIGFIHRGAMAIPYESELVTARMMRDALSAIDVFSLEQFVLNEREYHGIFSKMSVMKSPLTKEIADFYASYGGYDDVR